MGHRGWMSVIAYYMFLHAFQIVGIKSAQDISSCLSIPSHLVLSNRPQTLFISEHKPGDNGGFVHILLANIKNESKILCIHIQCLFFFLLQSAMAKACSRTKGSPSFTRKANTNAVGFARDSELLSYMTTATLKQTQHSEMQKIVALPHH